MNFVDLYVSSHFNRIITNHKNIEKFRKKVVVPYMPNIKKKFLKDLIIYPISIKKSFFKANKKRCILPNMLSFGYAVSIASLLKPKIIYLAGFDGYSKSEDFLKNFEMNQTVNIIRKIYKSSKIVSITPTPYQIDSLFYENL